MDRTPRSPTRLPKKVLTEATLLTLQISDAIQRPLVGTVITRPRSAVVEQCVNRFPATSAFRSDDDVSGARNSIRRLSRLFPVMTRRYRSLRSEVRKAGHHPAGTSGRSSGGITGMTVMIPLGGCRTRGRIQRLQTLMIFFGFSSPSPLSDSAPSWSASASRIDGSQHFRGSLSRRYWRVKRGPWPRHPERSNVLFLGHHLTIVRSADRVRITTLVFKSTARAPDSRSVISASGRLRDGSGLEGTRCAGNRRRQLMWPIRSRRNLLQVTSTPHFSQTLRGYFMRLYLPHRHS